MNILLIGHQGYLGSGLHAYLAPRHPVTGWGSRENLFSLSAAVLARESVEVIVNCAVRMDRISTAYQIPSPSDEVNVGGARHLASILKGSDILWFQISTKDVYGPVYGPGSILKVKAGYRPRFFVDDDRPLAPETVYAKSKLMAEFVSQSHARSNVIRLASCYTDFDHPRGNWVVNMIKAALDRRPVPVARDGRQFRDPLHVDDLGRLIERMAERNIVGQTLNAGGGRRNLVSIREFLHWVDPEARMEKIAGGDYGFAFSNRRARRLAGWSPRILFRERVVAIAENVRLGRTAQCLAA